jgi:hypothetical protein
MNTTRRWWLRDDGITQPLEDDVEPHRWWCQGCGFSTANLIVALDHNEAFTTVHSLIERSCGCRYVSHPPSARTYLRTCGKHHDMVWPASPAG